MQERERCAQVRECETLKARQSANSNQWRKGNLEKSRAIWRAYRLRKLASETPEQRKARLKKQREYTRDYRAAAGITRDDSIKGNPV